MTTRNDPNIEQLDRAVALIGELADELTLVGGCAAGLLITDPAASPVRPTLDVDFVLNATYAEYHAFGKRLQEKGFSPGREPKDPICRWRLGTCCLDLMPMDERVLGFSNRWYRSAVERHLRRRLPSGRSIFHIDGPHFLATKLDAFDSRGAGDIVASEDIEDLVRVIDGRPEVVEECARASDGVRRYVQESLARCLGSSRFLEAMPSYFAAGETRARARIVEGRFRAMIDAGSVSD